jgi:phage tail sheath protein FI
MVNSAGIARDLPVLETGTEVFRRILEVNVLGSFVVAREAARMMRGRGGAIVNIASVSGIKGNEGRVAYGASKGADFRADRRGIRVYDGRTMSSDATWRYVNVRRLLLYIEESIEEGTQWVVFKPNDEPLWSRVRQSVRNFLLLTWRSGALQGQKEEEAFFVKCHPTTMTQADIDAGRLIAHIGVAPVKPAEFDIFRIQLNTATE